MGRMPNTLKIEFRFPEGSGAFYDPLHKKAYIYGPVPSIKSLSEAISHETIHFILQKELNKRTSNKLDKLGEYIKKWDRQVFETLY